MIVGSVDIIRHFFKVEATREKFSHLQKELLTWCELPDLQLLDKARGFADSRNDRNPVFVYTIGFESDNRHMHVASWTKERIRCGDVYTCGISPAMRGDLDSVSGNLAAFASLHAGKYREFRELGPLSEEAKVLIVVHQQKEGREGRYELIDGAHRLVGHLLAGSDEVEAFVAHLS